MADLRTVTPDRCTSRATRGSPVAAPSGRTTGTTGAGHQETTMPRGDKSKYTDKQDRQADHIEEGYEKRGVPKDEAERRAWATVNKISGGGKKSGSGRGKKENKEPMRRGGKKGGEARGAAGKAGAAKKTTAKKSAAKQ